MRVAAAKSRSTERARLSAVQAFPPFSFHSQNSRPPKNKNVQKDPSPHDPIPVNGGNGYIKTMFFVDTLNECPKRHIDIFGRHDNKVDHMHSKNRPRDGTVGVVIPFE